MLVKMGLAFYFKKVRPISYSNECSRKSSFASFSSAIRVLIKFDRIAVNTGTAFSTEALNPMDHFAVFKVERGAETTYFD